MNGYLYIADNSRRPRIGSVDSASGTISTLPVQGWVIPSSLAMHPDGRICFTQIGRFSDDGPEGERTLRCLVSIPPPECRRGSPASGIRRCRGRRPCHQRDLRRLLQSLAIAREGGISVT